MYYTSGDKYDYAPAAAAAKASILASHASTA